MSDHDRTAWGRPLWLTITYYAIIAWFCFAMLFPILWLVLAAFKTNAEILSASGYFPRQWSLDGFEDALTEIGLIRYLANSFLVSAGAASLVVVVSAMAAYPVARFEFRGRNIVVTVFALGLVMPFSALIVPETLIIRTLGLYDTRIGLMLLYAGLFLPISFLVMRAFFLSLPLSIEEAAIMDGASYWQIFTRIVLPLSGPGISTVAIMIFVFTWNEFLFATLVLSSEDKRTAQVAIRFFQSQFDFNLPGMFAAITVVMLVPIMVFIVLQERVVRGLTAGAVKG
ncbi:MAG: carbohydrate ABC transporter permease [Roseitalea porphyridii]|uniref:carbohydrate ABC transporter permease n=1 Tax=Roseitalea porphyridii TaxID=1852022 RepID=UPI0032ECC8DC